MYELHKGDRRHQQKRMPFSTTVRMSESIRKNTKNEPENASMTFHKMRWSTPRQRQRDLTATVAVSRTPEDTPSRSPPTDKAVCGPSDVPNSIILSVWCQGTLLDFRRSSPLLHIHHTNRRLTGMQPILHGQPPAINEAILRHSCQTLPPVVNTDNGTCCCFSQ